MKKKLKKSENIIISDDNKNIEREENNRRNYSKTAMKICIASIIINVALTVFKIIAGILGNSFAMISDAIHSASDVFSTFIVMIGVKIASKKADREHPFGHERFECVAAIILSVMLGVTGAMIGINGIQRIADGSYKEVSFRSRCFHYCKGNNVLDNQYSSEENKFGFFESRRLAPPFRRSFEYRQLHRNTFLYARFSRYGFRGCNRHQLDDTESSNFRI